MLYMMIKLLFLILFSSLLNASTNNYTLELLLDKKEIFLGETLHATLLFTYKDLQDYELQEIKIPNFTLKELDSSDYKKDALTFVEEIHYELTPIRSGKFQIGKFTINIETLTQEYKHFNNASKYTKKFSIVSNSLEVSIKALKDGVSAIGRYTLSAIVDKTELKSKEILTYTIRLQGKGNIQNLDALKIEIKNATSYLIMSSKSSKEQLYTKTFEIIAEDSYTIPIIKLQYFDKDFNAIKVTQTQAIDIKILHSKNKLEKSTHYLLFLLFFFLHIIYLFLFYFTYNKKNNQDEKTQLLQMLKQTKTMRELYKKTVVHLSKDTQLDTLIYILEENNVSQFKKIKKIVLKRVKDINLSQV